MAGVLSESQVISGRKPLGAEELTKMVLTYLESTSGNLNLQSIGCSVLSLGCSKKALDILRHP